MTWIQVVILGIVEGITEFLPISSTGHMIITSSIMGINEEAFTKLFEVVIQFGAILSVVALYWRKFFDFARWQFYIKLIVAIIPAGICGMLFSSKIDALLGSSMTVGVSFLVGGIVLLFVDNIFKQGTIDDDKNISYPKAFIIGCWQVLAMIPGVSRSASTIVGGLSQKLARKEAAEFAFFLAVPTMAAASGKKLWDFHKEHYVFQPGQVNMLIVGNVIAFIVALFAVKTFITYLQKHSFRAFGIYRIIAGIAVLTMIYMGVIKKEEPKVTDAPKATTSIYQSIDRRVALK